MRRYLGSIVVSALFLWPVPTHAQPAAIQIGYIPSPPPGINHFDLFISTSDCGSDAGCIVLGDAGSGHVSAPGDDAAAVMAAVDAAMASANCFGHPTFDPPIDIPGTTTGEIRHEYRVSSDPYGGQSLYGSSIVFDRGAMSFNMKNPCGGPYYPNLIGPYHIGMSGPPAGAGDFRVLFEGGTEVLTPIDPSMTLQGIADAVTGSARDKGIDAAEYGTASVVFNPHKPNQDVTGFDFVGIADGTPMKIDVGNDLYLWVPAKPSTWGKVKATYR